MPGVVEEKTSTRSSDYEWSGLSIRTPMNKGIDQADLEVLMGFNGSVTQGHYVPICNFLG